MNYIYYMSEKKPEPIIITYDGVTYTSTDGGCSWDNYLAVTNANIRSTINDICTTLGWTTNLNWLDVSGVTDMSYCFANGGGINNQAFNGRIDCWDTSFVTNMRSMFGGSIFNQSLNWDTSSVTNMNGMFSGSIFNQSLNWDTSSVTDMGHMFNGATNFNQPLNWVTSSVTNMRYMFINAYNFNQPLNFDTRNVTNMRNMFNNATNFNQPLNWVTSSVNDMGVMFAHATNFNQSLNWDTSNVTTMTYMFSNATNFNQDISNWCVELIYSKPNSFDDGSGFDGNSAKQPQWGQPC